MKHQKSMTAEAIATRTPKLRFPEFRGEPDWEPKELCTLADPVSERADIEDQNNILTLSGEHGLVLQSEYFGKQIAGSNSDRYLRIHRDDFVYNDRTTKASTYGTIKRLKSYPHGIVSPIYKCFRFKEAELPTFWEWYFESGAHEAQLRSLANEGARAGRFNVSIDRFLSTSACAPVASSAEQRKIAECMSTLDELIGAESQRLDALQAHRKGLIQQLFPRDGETVPCLRFLEFQNAPEWALSSIQELIDTGHLIGHLDGNHGALYPRAEEFSSSGVPYITANDFAEGFVDFARCRYLPLARALKFRKGVAKDGDILFAHNATVGPVAKLSTSIDFVILSTTATYFRCNLSRLVNDFLACALTSPTFVNQYSRVMAQSTRNQVPITAQRKFLLQIPSVPEQKRIASCLTCLDELIAAHGNKLESLKIHKRGLMQQLFPSTVETEG